MLEQIVFLRMYQYLATDIEKLTLSSIHVKKCSMPQRNQVNMRRTEATGQSDNQFVNHLNQVRVGYSCC